MQIKFAHCLIDSDRHRFFRGSEPVHLEPQVFDLLMLLATSDGELVTRDIMIEKVWRGLTVSEATISARINAARKPVGDDGKRQSVIKTVPRRGFQLVVPVTMTGDAPTPRANPKADSQQTVRFTTSADGVNIAYAQSGNGLPLLRAAHWISHLEMDWDSPVWRPLLQRLSSRHRLIRYDQRGTALSGRDFPGKGIDEFVDDLAAVADAAGLDRFPILAPSQAAPVAITFAARYPDRVSKLILLGGYAVGRALRPAAPGDVEEEIMLSLIKSGWGQHGSAFVQAFSSFFIPDATNEQIRSFVEIQLASASPEGAVKLRRLIDRFDVSDLLDQVQAPTLVMHARDDVVHPIDQGRQLASGIRDARFVMLDSANHIQLPQQAVFEKMLTEVEGFLASDHNNI